MGQFVSRFTGSSTKTTNGEVATKSIGEDEVTTDIKDEDNEASTGVIISEGQVHETNGKTEEHEVTSSGEDDSLLVNTGNDSTRQIDLTLDSAKVDEEDTEDEESVNESNGHKNGVTNGTNHHADANGSSVPAEQPQPTWANIVAGHHPAVSSLVESEDSRSESSSVQESGESVTRGGRKRTKSSRNSPNKRMARDSDEVRPFACSAPGCEWAFKALFHLNRHRKTVHGILEPVTAATYALSVEQHVSKEASLNSGQSFQVDHESHILFDNILESGQY